MARNLLLGILAGDPDADIEGSARLLERLLSDEEASKLVDDWKSRLLDFLDQRLQELLDSLHGLRNGRPAQKAAAAKAPRERGRPAKSVKAATAGGGKSEYGKKSRLLYEHICGGNDTTNTRQALAKWWHKNAAMNDDDAVFSKCMSRLDAALTALKKSETMKIMVEGGIARPFRSRP
ncbi:MAG: hypothetical protein WC518_04205 [Patescibacteria group bacterium]